MLKAPTMKEIQDKVLGLFELELDDFRKHLKTRKSKYQQPRHLIVAIARIYYGRAKSYEQIGAFFGKDHATAMNSCKRVKNYIETDKEYVAFILPVLQPALDFIEERNKFIKGKFKIDFD